MPVPSFGDSARSSVKAAVVGLNPALDEFRDGRMWKSASQRLAIVDDYGRSEREELSAENIEDCERRRAEYFAEPGRRWHGYFEPIEELLGRINWRWSFAAGTAVHVDLVACATEERWGRTDGAMKEAMVTNCRPHFLKTLEGLPAETVLLLNGKGVCDRIEGLGERCRFDCGPELIAIQGQLAGRRGSVEMAGRRLRFFGWDSFLRDVGRLQRLDLVSWIRQGLGRLRE